MSNLDNHLTNLSNNEWCVQQFIMSNYQFFRELKLLAAFSLATLTSFFLGYTSILFFFVPLLSFFFYKSCVIYTKEVKPSKTIIDLIFKNIETTNDIHVFLSERELLLLSKKDDVSQKMELKLLNHDIKTLFLEIGECKAIKKNYISTAAFIQRLIDSKKHFEALKD